MRGGGAARQSEGEQTYRYRGRWAASREVAPAAPRQKPTNNTPTRESRQLLPRVGARPGGGGLVEAATGGLGRRINNPDRRSPAGCAGLEPGRSGRRRAARAGVSRAFSEARAVSRCRSPHPDLYVCVCVCLYMCVCVSMCMSVRWRARAPGRARVLLAMRTVHTRRTEPPLLGGAGWGKGRLRGF